LQQVTSGSDGHARSSDGRGDRPPMSSATRQPRRARRTRRFRLMRRRDLVAISFVVLGLYVVLGGHPSRPFEPLDRVLDRAIAATGLTIVRVDISGLRHADEDRIYDLIDATGAKTLFGFRPAALREAILASRPWVRDVDIIRDWPNRLRLNVTEREAFGVLHETRAGQRRAILIDATGVHLGAVPPEAPPPLPQIAGVGGEKTAARMVAMTEAHPDLAAQVLLYEFVHGRRWSLHLRGGRVVHLPTTGESIALAQFATHLERTDVAGARVVDLRRPGHISLHGRAPATQADIGPVASNGRRS
jgi:cell division septal protein FtsQ